MPRVIRQAALGLFFVVTAASVLIAALALSGHLGEDDDGGSARPPPTSRQVDGSEPRRVTPPAASRSITRAAPRPAPSATAISLAAVRGDSWVSVRSRSATGQVLFEGVLTRGASRTFRGGPVWVRFGAAANLDVLVNGRPAQVPAGTVDVVLPTPP